MKMALHPRGCYYLTADSFFDVFFEIELTPFSPDDELRNGDLVDYVIEGVGHSLILHNESPLRIESVIGKKSCALGDAYCAETVVPLFGDDIISAGLGEPEGKIRSLCIRFCDGIVVGGEVEAEKLLTIIAL